MSTIKIQYFGLERDFTQGKQVWTKVGIIGVPTDTTYGAVRDSLELLEHFRVVPILDRSVWSSVFEEGRLIAYKELLTAIQILSIERKVQDE
jgi:hypothetical protein